MKQETFAVYEELFERYPTLTCVKSEVLYAYELLFAAFRRRARLFLSGNGGSASDCEHIAGELLKSFKKKRPVDKETAVNLTQFGEKGEYLSSKLEGALSATSLISQSGILTAFANDKAWDVAIAQQLYGQGRMGDCLMLLSTSGNSQNCVYAAMVAKVMGIKTIALTGRSGGELKDLCTVCIRVPEEQTYKVQELHLPIYHCICAMLEEEFF